MADLEIRTEAAAAAAERLGELNRAMDEQFVQVKKAVERLEQHWDGEASSRAVSKFYEVCHGAVADRRHVMENYRSFLKGQIAGGYEETESANRSVAEKLADAFK